MELSLSRLNGNGVRVGIEPELLESLYHGNGYTLQDISDIFGCHHETIRLMMIEYCIQRHGVTDFTFNDRQKEMFEGCMLGDGGLIWKGNNCYFRNTDIHEEYLLWLQNQLGVEHISNVKPNYVDGFAYAYFLGTRVIPSIREEHKRWYPYDTRKGTNHNRNTKIVPKDIELTPIKMLFWYIGDGHYVKRDGAVVFSNYFDFDTWEMLLKKVCKVLDVDGGVSINKGGNGDNDNQIYCLRLSKSTTRRFFDLVNALDFEIPKCYMYKFGIGDEINV